MRFSPTKEAHGIASVASRTSADLLIVISLPSDPCPGKFGTGGPEQATASLRSHIIQLAYPAKG